MQCSILSESLTDGTDVMVRSESRVIIHDSAKLLDLNQKGVTVQEPATSRNADRFSKFVHE